jgi:hypothetical protein
MALPDGMVIIPADPEIGPQPSGVQPFWAAYQNDEDPLTTPTPALNIFRNGLIVDEAGDVMTPPGKGPFFDVNWPGPVDWIRVNPTGNSLIVFNGFILGEDGTVLNTTPPTGIAPGPPSGPTGVITGVTVTAGGTGYTAPTAVIHTANGSGAVLAVTQAAGVVTGVTVTSGGSGYRSTDTVEIDDPNGTGATATLVIPMPSIAPLARAASLPPSPSAAPPPRNSAPRRTPPPKRR